jgi:hypothetical protein
MGIGIKEKDLRKQELTPMTDKEIILKYKRRKEALKQRLLKE